MRVLFDELLSRFPEIAPRIQAGEEEMPYLTMGYLVDWLDGVGKKEFAPAIIARLVDFAKWCEQQPREGTADDDIWTIYVVALFEALFLHENTKSLIPHVTTKADLEANAKYLTAWVGVENYHEALEQFRQD